MRLIDADELIEQMEADAEHMDDFIAQMMLYASISDVKHAPTIELTQGGDLISRQEALDICNIAIDLWHSQLGEGALIAVRDKIRDLPTIDIDLSKYSDKLGQLAYERGKAERKKGEWIVQDGAVCCSECGEPNMEWNYCPNCGADMR